MKQKNEEGAIVIDATISLTTFMFLITLILAITNICLAQAKIGTMVNGIAKDVSNYSYLYSMTGLNSWEQGVSSGADKARGDLDQLFSDTATTYEKIGTIRDNIGNKEFWESLKNLFIEQAWNTGKGEALNVVCREIAKERMSISGQDADTYLKALGISDGVKGLHFEKSEFCPGGKDDIKIVVTYKIHLLQFFGTNWEFQFQQCAKTKIWNAPKRK